MGRTQIFLDGWLTQARRYNISSELIFVEWNPPADRPPLAEALKWPADFGPCTVRFIEVPAEVHQRYRHAAGLPLYQMIGKNVGIRRARGRFILATNIDILFSNELAEFLGARQLEVNRLYRVDRYDAMSDVPADAPLDEQLAYCRTHLLRVNRREGTFEVTPDGGPALSAEDIASPESGILLGQGWFTPERLGPMEAFRWAQEKAEVLLAARPRTRRGAGGGSRAWSGIPGQAGGTRSGDGRRANPGSTDAGRSQPVAPATSLPQAESLVVPGGG